MFYLHVQSSITSTWTSKKWRVKILISFRKCQSYFECLHKEHGSFQSTYITSKQTNFYVFEQMYKQYLLKVISRWKARIGKIARTYGRQHYFHTYMHLLFLSSFSVYFSSPCPCQYILYNAVFKSKWFINQIRVKKFALVNRSVIHEQWHLLREKKNKSTVVI